MKTNKDKVRNLVTFGVTDEELDMIDLARGAMTKSSFVRETVVKAIRRL